MLKRCILITVFILPTIAGAQYQRPGSSTAQFLNIGVSPRAEAMAGAYISVAEGAEGVYYNPAVLTKISSTDIQFTYTNWFAGIKHEFFSLAHRLGNQHAVALSVTALQTDEMTVRTPLQPDGTGETFYAGSYRVGISLARQLTNHVSIGVTGNYIRMSLYGDFAQNAFAGDIAALYDVGFRDLRFGFIMSNFGSSVTFVHEQYPLPTSFSFGLSMNAIEFSNQAFLLSVTAKKPNDGSPLGMIGGEYSLLNVISLRAGYHFEDVVKTFALGVGANVPIGPNMLSFDYSYSDYSLLGAAQRFGISFTFR